MKFLIEVAKWCVDIGIVDSDNLDLKPQFYKETIDNENDHDKKNMENIESFLKGYKITEQLRKGSQGVVFKVEDTKSNNEKYFIS